MAVLKGEFVCPDCAARLRIQQRGADSAHITCPECTAQFVVRKAADSGLVIEQPAAALNIDNPFSRPPRSSAMATWIMLGTIVLAVLIGAYWLTWSTQVEDQQTAADGKTNETAAPAGVDKPVVMPNEPVAAVDPQPSPPTPQEPTQSQELTNPFAIRLGELGQTVNRFRDQRQKFPPALWEHFDDLENDQPFSWLAGLDPALDTDKTLLPQWNLPWDNPLNERFVRRKRDDLLNPSVRLKTNADRDPASHVVGIAGVGADAGLLPKTDPRAGIFGFNRTTTLDDVRDGLSNTLLATGVTGKLASWADGRASIRGLTQPPYVNGPDGLGTGQNDGMYVLMADGSVRFLNAKTDPVIVRRMAAMADGLPLDAAVPGEPGEDATTKTINQPASPKIDTPTVADQAMTPEQPPAQPAASEPVTPPQPAIDFDAILSQNVLRYELASSAPLEEVLVELEALMGVRIEFDATDFPIESPARRLPVSVSRNNETKAELLDDVLKSTGFSFEPRNDHLAIVRSKTDAEPQ